MSLGTPFTSKDRDEEEAEERVGRFAGCFAQSAVLLQCFSMHLRVALLSQRSPRLMPDAFVISSAKFARWHSLSRSSHSLTS